MWEQKPSLPFTTPHGILHHWQGPEGQGTWGWVIEKKWLYHSYLKRHFASSPKGSLLLKRLGLMLYALGTFKIKLQWGRWIKKASQSHTVILTGRWPCTDYLRSAQFWGETLSKICTWSSSILRFILITDSEELLYQLMVCPWAGSETFRIITHFSLVSHSIWAVNISLKNWMRCLKLLTWNNPFNCDPDLSSPPLSCPSAIPQLACMLQSALVSGSSGPGVGLFTQWGCPRQGHHQWATGRLWANWILLQVCTIVLIDLSIVYF